MEFYNLEGLDHLSRKERLRVEQYIEQATRRIALQDQIAELAAYCFERSYPTQKSFSDKHNTTLMTNCAARFLDATNLLVKQSNVEMMKRDEFKPK